MAIAALLLQIQSVPQVTFAADLAPATAEVETADTTSAKPSARPSQTSPDVSNAPVSTSPRINLQDVTLNANDSKATSAALTNVSLSDVQKGQSLSTVRIPETTATKPVELSPAKTLPARRTWLALVVAQHGAATFDAYSTRQAISHGAVEDNPMLRPFAHSGAIYAAIQATPVLLDFVGRRMQRSENGMIRHMWWMPQTLSTAVFIVSGVHNLSVAGRH
ncbi:MAG: hypothetical protein WBP79_00215 [Candidatus Acidiferrales bacterium]